MKNARIILDNGGGITLQLGDFAHFYDCAEAATRDLLAYMDNPDTSDWEGHESFAAECDPTIDEIQNGGYRVIWLDANARTQQALAEQLAGVNWGNADDMVAALRNEGVA